MSPSQLIRPTIFFLLVIYAAPLRAGSQTLRYLPPGPAVSLADKRINESSGLVASRRHPGLFWTHNDSGDGPYLFVTDKSGRAIGRFTVLGATNVDWEDIAAGPGAGESAQLYIGDIGDNGKTRTDTAIYRVYEPAVDASRTRQDGSTMLAEKYPYHYPDGHHDAETLLVHPTTGDIYVVTKEGSGLSGVYRFPLPLRRNTIVTLEKVAQISFTGMSLPGNLEKYERYMRMATGGDISADGTKLVIRTYTEAYEWTMKSDEPIEVVLRRAPYRFALPLGQGESICYSFDGQSLYMTAEGSPCPMWAMHRPAKVKAAAKRSAKRIWNKSTAILRKYRYNSANL